MDSIKRANEWGCARLAGGLAAVMLSLCVGVVQAEELHRGPTTGKAIPPQSAEALPGNPSVQQIMGCLVFADPLVADAGQPPAQGENAALSVALKKYASRKEADDFSSITGFLFQYPFSTWKVSLLSNLGGLYYRTGYFDKAMDAWQEAWETGKSSKDSGIESEANWAVSQYARMNSRLGRIDRLESIFAEIKGRNFTGPAGQYILAAREAHWLMINRSGEAFRCGPLAIHSIAKFEKLPIKTIALTDQCLSTKMGVSLAAVKKLADKIGLNFQLARRSPGAPIILPAVVHWKVGHYGALLQRRGNRIELEDPTFGERNDITVKALDAEASGYFLVPAGPLPAGWEPVTLQEADNVWGKGTVTGKDTNRTDKCDNQSGGDSGGGCTGMASYRIHTMLVSLYINDTPLLFRPPVGESLNFTMSYSQRGMLPTSMSTVSPYLNTGQWTHNWFSFIADDPTDPYPTELDLYDRGGGIRPYMFTSGTVSDPQASDQSTLTIVSTGGSPEYVINYTDGSQEVFSVAGSTVGSGRPVFLSESIDPAGNETLLSYDAYNRLASVSGSAAASLNFTYNADNSLALVSASSALGSGTSWSASFGYVTSGTLSSITDAAGMTSSFTYSGSFISSMTTPYGTTTFSGGDANDDNEITASDVRWFQATDPAGATERLEFDDAAPIPDSDGTNTIPQNLPASCTTISNQYLSDRNSFYWSKKAFMDAPGDYSKAVITHWLHLDNYTVSGVVESEKMPFENRVWYLYPYQENSYTVSGSSDDLPTTVARVLDSTNPSGSTQIYQYQYNSAGNPTQVIDPAGRVTTYAYAGNNLDVIGVYQNNPSAATGTDQIAAYSYNSQHEVLSATNAAGQVTTFSYYGNGEIHTRAVVQSGSSETTTWSYDGNGFLDEITGPISSATTGFTYDSRDRVQTMTDCLGLTGSFSYDGLNRLTSVSYGDGTSDQLIYNRRDVEWKKDRDNRWTHYLHDQLGRLVYVVDPAGHATQYQYCPCGALSGIIDGNGNTTSFILDDHSRVTQKVFNDASTIDYNYEPDTSRLQSIEDAKGQTTAYSYNLDNTLAGVSYSGTGPSTPSVSYSYDPNYPRLTGMADAVSGSTALNYNPASVTGSVGGGMLYSVVNTGSFGHTLTYGYDELGDVISRAIDGGTNTETTQYDPLQRIIRVVNLTGTYGYTPYEGANLVQQISYPNGQNVKFGYYTSGVSNERLESIINTGPVTDGTISQFGYGYDAAGDITSWTQEADGSNSVGYAYNYDGSSELLSAVLASGSSRFGLDTYAWHYDGAGNRTAQQLNDAVSSAAYNDLNQVTSVTGTGTQQLMISGSLSESGLGESGTVTVAGASVTTDSNYNFTAYAPVTAGSNNIPISATDVNGNVTNKTLGVNVTAGSAIPSLTYDANGNLTSEVTATGTTNFVWDMADRLVKIWYGPIGNSSNTSMNYDGFGRRVQIIETSSTGAVTKNLIWDGMEIREERNASNAVTKMYFDNGVRIGGTNYYYTRDHLGSIRELTGTNELVQARYDYDPYGQQTQLSGTITADFGFTGLYYHQPSGLLLAAYREYSPALGRWLGRDPIGERGGINLYGYVLDDPINLIDPLGLCPVPRLNGKPSTTAQWNSAVSNTIAATAIVAAAAVAAPAAVSVAADSAYLATAGAYVAVTGAGAATAAALANPGVMANVEDATSEFAGGYAPTGLPNGNWPAITGAGVSVLQDNLDALTPDDGSGTPYTPGDKQPQTKSCY